MNNKKGIIASAIFVLSMVIAMANVVAHAPAAHAAECGITTAEIAQITAIQNNPSLSPSDEIKAELALRKQLVGETIGCAQQEVQAVQVTLASTSVESDVQSLQSQMMGNLNESAEFYNAELQKLNVVGIAGTKAIAQEVLSWRDGTFIPLSDNASNLILWNQNQDLFNTAAARMTQTERAVSFLEGAAPNPALQTALASAQSSFNDAQSENDAAKIALIENYSANQSLMLIKQSLASLSATYQDFSTVSSLINGILPQ
jgi:hypothetical protein